MDRFQWAALLAGLCLGAATPARAQRLSVSGDPAPLVVSTAVPGFAPDPVTDATTTYDVTVGPGQSRIVARLDAPLPPGVTLMVELVPPTGGTSLGPVALTTADQDVVVDIPTSTIEAGLQIRYTLAATPDAGVVAAQTLQVTFTVVSPVGRPGRPGRPGSGRAAARPIGFP
ncbi:MAG TPA: hypothetical protein VF212_07395 [Longimicrobiales bacterium]